MIDFTNLLASSKNTNLTGWVSNGYFFFSKPEALLYATKHKTNVEYYYNNHVFDYVDWSIEPTETLQELYRQRALDLRDQYDYIVALFSGGSDSVNMVKTFLNNNIFIDEVVSYGAWNNCMDLQDNCNIEVTLAGKPVIDEILKSSSRFTHLNLFDQFDQAYLNSDWILSSDTYMAVYTDFVQKSLYSIPHVNRMIDQGKKVCYLWGLEKPLITVNHSCYYLTFMDQRHNSNQYGVTYNNGFAQEWFYSDVSCSQLMSKQVHTIINYFQSNFELSEILTKFMIGPGDLLPQLNTLLYPDTWDPSTFSLGKTLNNLHSLKWSTFETQMNQSRQYKNWAGGVTDFVKSVDSKFLSLTQKNNLKKFFKSYLIQPC